MIEHLYLHSVHAVWYACHGLVELHDGPLTFWQPDLARRRAVQAPVHSLLSSFPDDVYSVGTYALEPTSGQCRDKQYFTCIHDRGKNKIALNVSPLQLLLMSAPDNAYSPQQLLLVAFVIHRTNSMVLAYHLTLLGIVISKSVHTACLVGVDSFRPSVMFKVMNRVTDCSQVFAVSINDHWYLLLAHHKLQKISKGLLNRGSFGIQRHFFWNGLIFYMKVVGSAGCMGRSMGLKTNYLEPT